MKRELAIHISFTSVPLAAGVLGAAVATTVEFAPLPLDDTLRVTLAGGAGIMLGLSLI